MSEVFLKIINMSISASWLVLVVLVLRFFLKKAPKWVNILLWGIVAIRLICPFSFESVLSLIPSAKTIPLNIGTDTTPAIDSGFHALNNIVNPFISQSNTPMPGKSINSLQLTIAIFECIWVLGITAMAVYTAISYLKLHHKIDTAIHYKDSIFQSENVNSPFVLGILKPKIYLPFKLNEHDVEYVIAHEQAHIRRKDHWWKPLGFLLLTIHWFNPLMWVAYILLCRDIELACDEKVVKKFGNEQRANYMQTLVDCSVNRRMIAACPLAFGEVGVKERVKSMLNYKKPSFWVIIVAVTVCVVVAICFLTNPITSRESIKWAQDLSIEDIANAELAVFPESEDKLFTSLSDTELVTMVDLINHSKGKYQSEHREIDGSSIFFNISMKDGTAHEIGNIGNTYLFIDGDYYKADYDWLSSWYSDFGEVISPIPNGNIPVHPEYKPVGVSSSNVKELSSFPNDIKCQGGVSFVDLSPGKEVVSESTIKIDKDSSIMLIITWGAQDLFLEFGVRDENGTAYFQEKQGGSSFLLIENIPAGSYYLYVKNSNAYDGIPAYENPDEFKDVSFDATGALNYTIIPD